MDQNMITLLIAVVALLISLYCFYAIITLRKKQPAPPEADGFTARPLQLQAYERLVMLAERISIPSIIGRANQQQGLNARQMQILLIESIKQEFEYNATQQIYVSPAAWGAIKNLKDQNQLIINPDSLKVVKGAFAEPALMQAKFDERYQFLRKGYFVLDKDSSTSGIVFNRTVTLKDAWAKEQKK